MQMNYMETPPSIGVNVFGQPVLVFSAVARTEPGYSAALRARYLYAEPLNTRVPA